MFDGVRFSSDFPQQMPEDVGDAGRIRTRRSKRRDRSVAKYFIVGAAFVSGGRLLDSQRRPFLSLALHLARKGRNILRGSHAK